MNGLGSFMILLSCRADHVQGKVGKDSTAAKFAAATNLKIENDKPYAEVRMPRHNLPRPL